MIEGDPKNTLRFRLLVVWGFTTITCLVSLRWIQYKDALKRDLTSIQDVKKRMGCGAMSDSKFEAFMKKGNFSMRQQLIMYEFEQRFSNRPPGWDTEDLIEIVEEFKGRWKTWKGDAAIHSS